MNTKLPVMLDNVRVATPCSADWDEMSGDARVRFCGKCEKNVYDLSALTRAEAETLLRQREGRLCVRFYQRADGTILTSDCPVGVRRARLRHRLWAAATGFTASVALALGVLAGRDARADLAVGGKKDPQTIKMGKVKMGEPAPAQMMGDVAPPRPLMGAVAVTEPPKPVGPPPQPAKKEPAKK